MQPAGAPLQKKLDKSFSKEALQNHFPKGYLVTEEDSIVGENNVSPTIESSSVTSYPFGQ